MLTKLMAFLRCQFAILSNLLQEILDNAKENHTNVVKINEVCAEAADPADPPVTLSVWAIWDQNADTFIGTRYLDANGTEVTSPLILDDCDCIASIECCPEDTAAVVKKTAAASNTKEG